MNTMRFFLLIGCFVVNVIGYAQTATVIDEMEAEHKQCLLVKEDSIVCSRRFFAQMDSMVNVVFNEVKLKASTKEKIALTEEQMSWTKKKGEFYKIQDETFVFNLKDGIWKKDMIRITYRQKADFALKRIRALLKKL